VIYPDQEDIDDYVKQQELAALTDEEKAIRQRNEWHKASFRFTIEAVCNLCGSHFHSFRDHNLPEPSEEEKLSRVKRALMEHDCDKLRVTNRDPWTPPRD